jgi:hypothetical protein
VFCGVFGLPLVTIVLMAFAGSWQGALPTSYTFDKSILDLTPNETSMYRLYAAVRCDATATEGPAMTLGVYDPTAKKGVSHKSLTISEIVGPEYRWIDLGPLPLEPGQYIWFAPPKRPGEVDAVYIDRIVVVREK